MTSEELEILRHSLGLKHGKKSYRNHFVTDANSPDGLICKRLCWAGMMEDWGAKAEYDGMNLYRVTELGFREATPR